MNNKRVRN